MEYIPPKLIFYKYHQIRAYGFYKPAGIGRGVEG